jgi:hypothetical protein
MPGMKRSYQVREITPVSTIGAGDNFNAGFIYGLATSGVNARNISGKIPAEIDRMVACGLAFAADTCLSADNYITENLSLISGNNIFDVTLHPEIPETEFDETKNCKIYSSCIGLEGNI